MCNIQSKEGVCNILFQKWLFIVYLLAGFQNQHSSNSLLPGLAWILMIYLHLTSCRSNHPEGLKGSQWVPQQRTPLSFRCSISPSGLTDAEALKCNLANEFFTEWSMHAGKTANWKSSRLKSVLSQQFVTEPSCAYASCQSEKVQMLLVPGGLVNRLHRLSPSCYSFCLAPPSLQLTVCACGWSPRCYIFCARHRTVACDPDLSGCVRCHVQ